MVDPHKRPHETGDSGDAADGFERTPDGELVFPHHILAASVVRRGYLWMIQNKDLQTVEDIEQLRSLMFQFPEGDFQFFVREGEQFAPLLRQQVDAHRINVISSAGLFYPHPNFKDDFVRIHDGPVPFKWEEETRSKGEVHWQHKLALWGENERILMENAQLIRQQEAYQEQKSPIELKPSWMGIGIDLRKVMRWFDRWLRSGGDQR